MRLLLIAALLVAGSAEAADWKRSVEVDYVEMTAAEVSKSKMRELRRKYRHDNFPPGQAWRGAGLALLWQREDGIYACNIYVLDISDQKALDHEIKHCHGWVH